MLVPFASPRRSSRVNEQLGANEPLLTQYTDWIGDILHGDSGRRTRSSRPVGDLIATAIEKSLKLACWRSSSSCRSASSAGSSPPSTSAARSTDDLDRRPVARVDAGVRRRHRPDPVFGLWLNVLPVSARWPPGRRRSSRSST
jgi:peptide/nickel transport system permease protein